MINNRFEISGKLGEGRSAVYRCSDKKSSGNFALKILAGTAADEEKSRFIQEYFTIRKLNHPGILKAYEYGTILESSYEYISPGSIYILLELFEGCELTGIKNLEEAALREIIIQVLSALQYLHLSNFIYYDLKPENILVSTSGSAPSIKIIDFGLARAAEDKTDKTTRGTAEYIAPELLKNELYDHRVDFYSFGMLLYKLIYGVFPFDNSSEIKVFRAQLEDRFGFPPNSYSSSINNVIQKLLQKDPESRYINAMQIFSELAYYPPSPVVSQWVPAKNFSGRKDILNILNSYLLNYSGGDIFIVKGSESSGKTALLTEFAREKKNAVLVENAKTRYGTDFICDFLEKVFYTESVFNCIPDELKFRIRKFLDNPPNNITDEIRGIFSQLIRSCSFLLLLDDFNFLDELSLQVFREIIPLLQVHNIKTIITENSDRPALSEFIHNQHQLNLAPFTDSQVQEYLDKSFYQYYPREELKKLILLYADLLPGSIESFIKDLVLFGIISFSQDSITINSDPESLEILKQSHEYFYKLRTSRLEPDELLTAEYLSSFETMPDRALLEKLLRSKNFDIDAALVSLRTKNILHFSGNLNQFSFSSAGMKNYIYDQIPDKKRFHSCNAEILEPLGTQYTKEIAFQYEAAGDYIRSIDKYMLLYNASAATDAYTYQKKLLEHVLTFPLEVSMKQMLQYELCKVLQKSGDASAALELCEELLIYISDTELLHEVLLLKGVSLIRVGRPEEGIKEIEHLVEILEDDERKQNLRSEIASAYLDLNNFTAAESLSKEILEAKPVDAETAGKCYNFLGLIAIHRDNDFDKAYENFKEAEKIYSLSGLKFRTAQMQSNLGNILNIKGDTRKAEDLWKSSLELNSTMGNLYHEANLQLNFGVMNFERLDYDKSIQYYKNALSIYSNTGDVKGEGLVNYNLGEIYYLSCDYGNALKCLMKARSVFQQVQDINEELETLFLMGWVYFQLGSRDEMQKVLADFNLLMNRVPGEKHSYNYRFLRVLLNRGNLNFFHEIKNIIGYYNKQGDKYNYFRSSMSAVHFLYDHELYKEALEEITEGNLVSASRENDYYRAEWNLYFGLITEKSGSYDVPPSEYYLKAFEFLEDLSISELTWKVLAVLTQFYYGRGNYLRAEEFAYYLKSLLEHISDSIDNEVLKKSYLMKKDVKEALDLQRKILRSNG